MAQGSAGVQMRIRKLVNEAGTRSAFIKRVWGDHAPAGIRTTVRRWQEGERGIGAAHAAKVAAKCGGRNSAWLLHGPPHPEYTNVDRPRKELHGDVRAFVLAGVLAQGRDGATWRPHADDLVADGDVLLQLAIQRELDRLEVAEDWAFVYDTIIRATVDHVERLGVKLPAGTLDKVKAQPFPGMALRKLQNQEWSTVATARGLTRLRAQQRKEKPEEIPEFDRGATLIALRNLHQPRRKRRRS